MKACMKDDIPSVLEDKKAESRSKAIVSGLFGCLGEKCRFVCRVWGRICTHMRECSMVEKSVPPIWHGQKSIKKTESRKKAITILSEEHENRTIPTDVTAQIRTRYNFQNKMIDTTTARTK